MSFSKVDIEGKRSAPNRIYYNGTVINNSIVTTQQYDDPEVEFQDQRQTSLVPDASNYEVSVQNFTLNGCQKTLPLFIPQINPQSPTDVTTTIYTVTVSVFDGTNYLTNTQPIIWVPETSTPYTNKPTTALPVQIESDYYYCYTYSNWVSLVNAALNAAWTAIGGGSAFGTQCPFLEYDETSGLFSLNQDTNTSMVPYGTTALPQPYNVTSSSTSPSGGTYSSGEYSFVGMNTCLEILLSNFPEIYFSSGQLWAGQTGIFLPEAIFDTGLSIDLLTGLSDTNTSVGVTLRTLPKTSVFQLINPFLGTPISGAYFARLTQDYLSTGSIWSPIASLVLATTQIPVRNEASSNPILLGTGTNGGNTTSGGAFQKVLIEAPIDALKADLWRGYVKYEPLIEKYSSLDPSQDGISDIDVQLYWRNRLTNALIPVRIPNQGSMSFRLLFKKKVVL